MEIKRVFDLLDRLQAALARAWREQGKFALLYLDLDKFKQVNDQYGHRAGDEVLVSVVRTLERNIRKDAFIGRYGGEEFLLLLPDTDARQLELIAERLRQLVARSALPVSVRTLVACALVGLVVMVNVPAHASQSPPWNRARCPGRTP